MSDPMFEHLSSTNLAALIDAELAGEDLIRVSQHLAACSTCTTRALNESLLKRSTARAGQRYAMPDTLEARMLAAITTQRQQETRMQSRSASSLRAPSRSGAWSRTSIWSGALAALLLVSVGGFVAHDVALRGAHRSALVAETVDEHIAAMASATPQVISTDRHTVKPWFQGKLPFSFNLPVSLPPDTTLDGANLVQLDGQPTAQLLFSIGKHHASVFLRQSSAAESSAHDATIDIAERNGFHVEGFRTSALDALVVSDADPHRLHDLAIALHQAQ